MYNRSPVDKMQRLTNSSPEIAVLLANTLKKRETAFTDHLVQREIRKSLGQPLVQAQVQSPAQGRILAKPDDISLMVFRKQLVSQVPSAFSMAMPMANAMAKYRPVGNLVTVNLNNGLGNWIFKILAGLGYAEKYGKEFVISRNNINYGPKLHEQGLLEKITRIFPSLPIVDLVPNIRMIHEKKQMNYNPLEACTSNVLLLGYFQDEQYFPSDSLIPSIRTDYYPNTYFVHIRAGDYLGTHEFDIGLVQYYKNCFSLLGSDVKYIIFSNDNAYADTYMKQFDVSYSISDKQDQVDALIEMANCAGGICANSSFSWLGGLFQGDKREKVFMPSIWFKGRDCRGIFPSWATVIDIYTGKIINTNFYKLSDVKIINIPSGRKLNYNACVMDNKIFFRAVNLVEKDEILISDFNVNTLEYVPNTIKTLSLVSKFNNKHVEDPRVIFHMGNFFVCYTDGYEVAIAKLDTNYNTIYSHYLKKPDNIIYEGGDGREKNWLPISMGDAIHFWYSDTPRTFLVYEDTGRSLEYKTCIKTEQRITSNFGSIRGGCPPIPYDDEKQIWFFHTLFEKKYRIGAYLTMGLTVVGITPYPILTGNHIVFPCGAIQYNGNFLISMGVQDKDIGILKVSRNLEFISV